MEQVFGYLPDPAPFLGADGSPLVGTQMVSLWGHEFEDHDYTELSFKLQPSSEGDADLSSFTTDTHQFALSACAGNATADAIEVLMRIEEAVKALAEGRAPNAIPEMSRLFVYSMARLLQDQDGDGKNDLNRDDGTFIRLCFDVLSRFGICREETWPYVPEKVFRSPSIRAQREAVGHRIHSYYRIRAVGDDRVAQIVDALRAQHPVVFGTDINEAFRTLRGDAPVGPPTGATIGGHAMLIVGYIDGNFLVKNSWGKSWGADGFCFMTPEYIKWNATRDIWVPTMGTTFKS